MTDTDSTRPVHVPNVSPNARSGLAGEVIGSAAAQAYDENEALAAQGEPITGYQDPDPDGKAGTGEAVNAETGEVTQPGEPLPPVEQTGGEPLIPADAESTEDLLAWVVEPDDDGEAGARAAVVYAREQQQEQPREDLLESLRSLLEDGKAPSGD